MNKITEKSKVFYKLYAVNIMITVVFICLISWVCSSFSSKLILNNFIAFNKDMIAEKGNVLDDRVRHLDEAVNQIVREEPVFRFIMTNGDEYEQPTTLVRIIRRFQETCLDNSLIKGVRLVDLQRRIEITETMKQNIVEEDYDRDLKQNSFLIRNYDEKERELQFVKRFEPVPGKKIVYLILTVDENAFISDLVIGREDGLVKSCLMTKTGDLLLVDGMDPLDEAIREELQNLPSGAEKFKTLTQKLVLYKTPSKISDISIAAYEDYTYLERQTREVKKMIIFASVAMILVASVIIYLCSLYFYRPLKRLGSKAKEMNDPGNEKKSQDEYSLIETRIDELQYEKEYAKPYAIRDAARRMVLEDFHQERFEYLKETLHQAMKFSQYFLMITRSENRDNTDLIKETYQKMIDEEPEMDGFFVDMTPYRCVGIFNTDFSYDEFLVKAEKVRKILEEKEILYICCLSQNFKDISDVRRIYAEVFHIMEKELFKGNATFVYENQIQERIQKYESWNRGEHQLIQYVVSGEEEKALQQLKNMTKNLGDQTTDIPYTQFQYFQICQELVSNVSELEVKIPKEYRDKELFQKIFQTHTIQELDGISEEILHCCLGYFQKKEKGYSSNVEKAMGFIRTNYMQDISIDDVAASVFLSSGYLSIIFKEETGYTVLEYITYVRMNKAKELVLQGTGLKVKEIAEQVGYHNVQSFIRYFKKYFGETPMAYRKNADGK